MYSTWWFTLLGRPLQALSRCGGYNHDMISAMTGLTSLHLPTYRCPITHARRSSQRAHEGVRDRRKYPSSRGERCRCCDSHNDSGPHVMPVSLVYWGRRVRNHPQDKRGGRDTGLSSVCSCELIPCVADRRRGQRRNCTSLARRPLRLVVRPLPFQERSGGLRL